MIFKHKPLALVLFANASKLTSTALVACMSVPVLAQTNRDSPVPGDAESVNEIVVIANRIPVPLRQVGTSVTVIDAEEIQAYGNLALTDVLRQTAAVAVSNNGGIGSTGSLRIRGEEGFRTLIRYDGLKLSDPSGPQVASPVEHIRSSGIGRVEILRGPQGLSYGADAGGVISISTAPVEAGVKANFNAQTGSRGSDELSANISGGNGVVDFSLVASDFTTEGYNVQLADTVLADRDGYENTSIHARLGVDVTEQLRLELVHRDVDGETEYDGCFAGFTQVYDCDALFEQQATRLAANYQSENFTHSLAYSTTETDRNDKASGISQFSSNGQLERWEYLGSATNLPGFDLVFGVDLEQEDNATLSRDNKGVHLEYLSDFSDSFFLTAGARFDDNDDFGDHTSYRVSAAYLIDLGNNNDVKFKTSYGTGFRAPSLFEINYNAGPSAQPPASTTILKEETSQGFEYGIEYNMGDRLRLEAVVFDQEVEAAIEFDLATFSGYLQDSGASHSDGYEFIAELAVTDELSLSANYTHNDTERPSGLQRLRRPETLVNLGLSYRGLNDRLKINGFYRASRDAIDEVFGTAVDLDDYQVLDITVSYEVFDGLEIYGRLENSLDEGYQEVSGFVSPDRASYIGVRFTL